MGKVTNWNNTSANIANEHLMGKITKYQGQNSGTKHVWLSTYEVWDYAVVIQSKTFKVSPYIVEETTSA